MWSVCTCWKLNDIVATVTEINAVIKLLHSPKYQSQQTIISTLNLVAVYRLQQGLTIIRTANKW